MSPANQSDPVEVMARAIFAEQHSSLDFDLCREATQSTYRSMARSALAAAEAAGWVMVPVSDRRFTVREVIDALIAAGFTRVQSARPDEAASITPQDKEQKT